MDQASPSIYQSIFESAGEGIITVNKTGNITMANPRAHQMFGYKKKELVGKPLEILIPQNVRKTHKQHRKDYIKEPRRRSMGSGMDLNGVKKNGDLFPLEVSLNYFGEGENIQVMAMLTDITERKESERTMAQQSLLIQKITDTSPLYIYLLNIQTREITFANKKVKELLASYSKDGKLLESYLKKKIHPDDLHIYESNLKACINKNKEDISEIEFRLADVSGNWNWIFCRKAVFKKDSDGKPTQILGIATDISQRIEAEQKLMSAMLEGQEQERKRVAKELHDGLGQILSAINLNLKTVEADLPESFKDDDSMKNAFKLIEQSIKEVRNISHGLMPGDLKDFGLVKALENMVKSINSAKLIHIHFHASGVKSRLPINLETALFRISQELLNNIFKHARANDVNLQLIKHKKSIVLMVEDDGVGFQGSFEDMKSNGIGLRNIAARVKSLNGILSLDSSHGIGTSVTIEIPID